MIAVLGGIAPGTMSADDGDANKNSGLIGTWHAVIRYPGFPNDYFVVLAFNPGGTATMVFVDGPRTSVSLGVWKQLRGRGNFAVSYDGLFDADSDGFFDRRFRDRLTLHLLDDDTFTGTASQRRADSRRFHPARAAASRNRPSGHARKSGSRVVGLTFVG